MILIDDTPDFSKNTIDYPKNPPCREMEFLYSDFLGKLIVLEGIDGSGKTTQRKKIAKYLCENGYQISECSFKQSATVHYSILKGKWENFDPYTNMLLYLASITDTLSHEILPSLKEGKFVLMDRYVYSLYVRALVRNVNPAFLNSLFSLRKPDLILFFDIDVNEALKRKGIKSEYDMSYWEAGGDLELSDNRINNWLMYQEKISAEYKKLFFKMYNVCLIDANQTEKDIHLQIVEKINEMLLDKNYLV